MCVPLLEKYLINVRVDSLIPYPGNPRRNNKSAVIVAASIRKYGYINPIVVTETFMVLAGHTRLKALKLLNYTHCDVLVVKGLSQTQIDGFVIADNRVGEYSQWNYASIDRLMTRQEPDEFIRQLGLSSFINNKGDLEDLINGSNET